MQLTFLSSWSGYEDELAWAAAWLAKATGESGYLETARALFEEGGLCGWVPTGFDWDSKTVGVYALMYELTQEDRSEPAALTMIYMVRPVGPKLRDFFKRFSRSARQRQEQISPNLVATF